MKPRIEYIVGLVRRYFPEARLPGVKTRAGRETFVLRLRLRVDRRALLEAREVWRSGRLIGYGYQLVITGYGSGDKDSVHVDALRYNNAPRHAEAPRFPTTSM
ncbi:hypothetical protein [Pyrodictium abyssi]|uniref:Uncharacterized protein n=1 Tax=Pyrodictium abyssi TaxID=54256 RepID=A0ABN6ZR08_9CREN|nr:hypothetical protein PABY_13910 [Pyrodictium abyssi]